MSSRRHRKGHIGVSFLKINLWFYENIVLFEMIEMGGNNLEVIEVGM